MKDALIEKVAIEGTQNILKLMNKNAAIIYQPWFWGLKRKIWLSEKTSTFLAYSTSKLENEQQIKNQELSMQFLIRICLWLFNRHNEVNIMPNLFSKIASQNGKIKLFGKGSQLKSLVPLVDVARCFKFVEEIDL